MKIFISIREGLKKMKKNSGKFQNRGSQQGDKTMSRLKLHVLRPKLCMLRPLLYVLRQNRASEEAKIYLSISGLIIFGKIFLLIWNFQW